MPIFSSRDPATHRALIGVSWRRRLARHPVLRFISLLFISYFAAVLLVAVFQRKLIYFPTLAPATALVPLAAGNGLEPWRDAAGAIIGWRQRRTTPAANRLVVFHGNAGFALHREYFVRGFEGLDGGRTWEVLLFEYPGYGARPGEPGEAAIKAAALAAALALRQGDDRPVFVAGESIGGGVATYLAGEPSAGVAGAFLVTPFTNLVEVATHHYPFLPVKLILRERYDCRAALREFRGPVAVLLAGRDEVVPTRFGQQLYDSYTGTKQLWVQEGASHNTVDYAPAARWWREVSDFLLDEAAGRSRAAHVP